MTQKNLGIMKDWNVLVVDDDPDSLEIASTMIEIQGANVVTAVNGEDALEKLKHMPRPHFILSDLSMPTMDGWEFIQVLKRDRTTLDIPVIALTAHAMEGDRIKAMAAGFHNHITKPLTPSTFISHLVVLLTDSENLANLLKNIPEEWRDNPETE